MYLDLVEMIESEKKPVLPGQGKMSGAYGVRTLRQLRKNNQEPSERLKKKIDTTYSYFLAEVDPVIGDLITYLLCDQPIDVPGAMLTYLTKRKEKLKELEQAGEKKDADVEQRKEVEESVEEAPPTPKINKRPKKEAKLYLAVSIGPLVTKLVNRIAVTRPKKVVDFMCEELNEMIYGGDEELKKEIEIDERFEMYKGMDGPKLPKAGDTVEVEVETPAVELKSAEPAEEPVPSTIKAPVVSEDEAHSIDVTIAVKAQSIQFAVLGMDNAGKSSIVNMLQGKGHVKTKPTIGFRPVSMMLDEQTTIRFYDIGGSKKIRDIWGQYYHDAHAIIYVVDLSEQDETRKQECKALFDATMAHSFVSGKPLLVLGNKADVDGGMSVDDLSSFLNLSEYTPLHNGNVGVSACSAALMESEGEAVDDRIEGNLEALIKTVQDNYIGLNDRVIVDSKTKAKEDQKKRLQRERTVLKNKIILAFADTVKEEFKPDETDIKKSNPEDSFTADEGLTFLCAELGEEQAALSPSALEIAAMVGYQRLALQIVGSLKVPISKKKDPMTWEEIHALVVEIRNELGLETAAGVLPTA